MLSLWFIATEKQHYIVFHAHLLTCPFYVFVSLILLFISTANILDMFLHFQLLYVVQLSVASYASSNYNSK